MKNFIKQFFAVDNQVNENTVMSVILLACLLVATFVPIVTDEKYYVLAGLLAVMSGVGAFKR